MAKTFLVTGGTGFLGSALVRRLVREGHHVRILDDNSRGAARRLGDVAGAVELYSGDIRDSNTVRRAARGVNCICHLAYINGTEFFYTKPDLVLDVAVRGMVNVLDACKEFKINELILMSSSEVYHEPPVVPTDESVPMSVPDPLNPRYSYGAGKIISEIMALNIGRALFKHLVIVRPHNVYGPEMGWEHVIPQFVLRMRALVHPECDTVQFPIQGTGLQTRSFVYIDDFVEGLMVVIHKGAHRNIYNIGTEDEVTIAEIAHLVGEFYGKHVEIVHGPPAPGGPLRRCPDISKLATLGYHPTVSLRNGLVITAKWYDDNFHLAPALTSEAKS